MSDRIQKVVTLKAPRELVARSRRAAVRHVVGVEFEGRSSRVRTCGKMTPTKGRRHREAAGGVSRPRVRLTVDRTSLMQMIALAASVALDERRLLRRADDADRDGARRSSAARS
jgi:hypothetical protein